MQRHAIHLLLDGGNDFRMAMAERKNSKPTQAINKFASMDIAQKAAVAKPFDYSARNCPRIGPAIQIRIEILDGFPDELVCLLSREIVFEGEVHVLKFSRPATVRSKNNVEATAKKSMVRIEELAEPRVGGIGAHVARVEMVGHVKDA